MLAVQKCASPHCAGTPGKNSNSSHSTVNSSVLFFFFFLQEEEKRKEDMYCPNCINYKRGFIVRNDTFSVTFCCNVCLCLERMFI